MVLFLTVDLPAAESIRDAVQRTFELRGTHPVPAELPLPPEAWRPAYDEMSDQADLRPADMDEGFQLLVDYWTSIRAST